MKSEKSTIEMRYTHDVTASDRTLTEGQLNNLRGFLAYAASKWAPSQKKLAAACGISQPMISRVIGGYETVGGKLLTRVSETTGISIEDILSGAGLRRLKARSAPGGLIVEMEEAKLRAAESLAKLYGIDVDDVLALLDASGVMIPSGAPATTWFDVGRGMVESRRPNGKKR